MMGDCRKELVALLGVIIFSALSSVCIFIARSQGERNFISNDGAFEERYFEQVALLGDEAGILLAYGLPDYIQVYDGGKWGEVHKYSDLSDFESVAVKDRLLFYSNATLRGFFGLVIDGGFVFKIDAEGNVVGSYRANPASFWNVAWNISPG